VVLDVIIIMRRLTLILLFVFTTITAKAGYPEGFQAFMEGDYETAFSEYKAEAEKGNAFAQADLGDMFYHGVGVNQDDTQALKWFKKAADQSHSRAQYNLGTMYENGKGVKQDYDQAIKWWCVASEQGHYGAEYNLAMMFYRGTGVPKDREEAARRMLKVAKQHLPSAQYHLGIMYMNGDGIDKSRSQAEFWLKRAYRNGDNDISNAAKKAREEMDYKSPKIRLF